MTHPKIPFENLQGISHSFALGMFERLKLKNNKPIKEADEMNQKGAIEGSFHVFCV